MDGRISGDLSNIGATSKHTFGCPVILGITWDGIGVCRNAKNKKKKQRNSTNTNANEYAQTMSCYTHTAHTYGPRCMTDTELLLRIFRLPTENKIISTTPVTRDQIKHCPNGIFPTAVDHECEHIYCVRIELGSSPVSALIKFVTSVWRNCSANHTFHRCNWSC